MSLESTPSTDQAPQTTAPASTPASTPATPGPIEVSDDAVLRYGGKEIPFSKYRGIESEYTKATQNLSKLQRELDQAKQEAQTYRSRIEQAQRPQQANPAAQMIEKLRSLTYLSGEEAAGVVEQILGANKQQQAVAYLLAKRIADLEQSLTGIRGEHTQRTFSQKIAGFRNQLDIPERFQKRLEELYLAYEGDDLDQEFPSIAKEWYDDIQAGLDEVRKAKVEAARKTPFIPGKGGQGSPSKPLQMSGAETPAEQADQVGAAFGLDWAR